MSENQNIEWKSSWRDEYLKWICGFANAHGGKLFIGKNDKDEVIGVTNHKKLMEDIPNKIQNRLGIICDVNLHSKNRKQFIEIIVKPYDVAISFQGKYHYRSGATKQELTGQSLTDFLLNKSGKTWDEIIEPKAKMSDIDNGAIEAFIESALNTRRLLVNRSDTSLKHVLANLRVVEDKSIKRAAILLFSKDPRKFFINAYLKIGKFGNSDSDLLSQEVVEGNAFQLADQALEILDKKYFTKSISYRGIHRIEKTEYPYEAIREILLNAIVHRSYSGAPIQVSIYNDRLMVWNPGKLPDGLTVEDLARKHASHPFNPLLADSFFKGGLIEAWGRGTLKVIDECKLHGLPIPKIELSGGGICVTVFKDIYIESILQTYDLTTRQIEALLFWKAKNEITTGQYCKKFAITDRTALRDLTILTEKKLLKKTGDKKSTKYLYMI